MADGPDDRLLLDELTDQLDRALALLRGDRDRAAELAFAQLGAASPLEGEIVRQLAARRPLRHPDRFDDAHALALRALEILDRDGWRAPALPRLGPMRPVARAAVERVARGIVRRHVGRVVRRLRKLYAQREGEARPGSQERRQLRTARLAVERSEPDYRDTGTGLPPFLAAGAAVPTLASFSKKVGALHLSVEVLVVLGGLFAIVLMVVLSWILLRAAALAHRRSELLVRGALRALWETVGDAGVPPRDESLGFATAAIAISALAWVAIPALVALLFWHR